jgi:hypothetical protein
LSFSSFSFGAGYQIQNLAQAKQTTPSCGFFSFFCVALGIKLRVYTLNPSTSPFFVMGVLGFFVFV